MVYKFISVKNIIESLYRDYDHSEELDIWDVVEWAGEALEFIGAGTQYEERVIELAVENHRVCLPIGFHLLNQISYQGVPLPIATGTLEPNTTNSTSGNVIMGKEINDANFPQYSSNNDFNYGNCYYINNNYVITSFESGCIIVSYKAMFLDDDGFPMIPDLISYRKAVSTYIQKMLDRREWRKARLPEAVYRDSEKEWHRLCGQARGQALMPNLDKMESIKNMWLRLRPKDNNYNSFFNTMGNKEYRKIQ